MLGSAFVACSAFLVVLMLFSIDLYIVFGLLGELTLYGCLGGAGCSPRGEFFG